MRASFIAAARRAAQAPQPEQDEIVMGEEEPVSEDEAQPASPPSLIERIRRSFDHHRRPLLFSLAFLILAAGTAQILSHGQDTSSSLVLVPDTDQSQTKAAKPGEAPKSTEGAAIPSEKNSLFQPSSLSTATITLTPPSAKFLVEPSTVKGIPSQVPAVLRQAALSGDAAALYEIASQAVEGRDMPQDIPLALHLYERAAQAGLPPAQERLAILLETGAGGQRDLKQALQWYERAAQGGNIRAMHKLATLLASDVTGKRDFPAALRWFSEAAEYGWRDSQFNTGIMLANGLGVRPDLPKAYIWFSLAAAQGDVSALKKRDEIAGRLTADQLSSAKASVEQWQPRPADPVANAAPAAGHGRTAALDRTFSTRS
jgi:localization factor PodJL